MLPRTAPDRRLDFAGVAGWDDLRAGRYGVLEPVPEAPSLALSPEDVVLVPGLAFDSAGNRLGRGAGCYDRTFSGAPEESPLLIGIGYDFQRIAFVPHGENDRRVEGVCWESEFLWVGSGETP